MGNPNRYRQGVGDNNMNEDRARFFGDLDIQTLPA